MKKIYGFRFPDRGFGKYRINKTVRAEKSRERACASPGSSNGCSPLNMVRRVVEYALTEIPAEKISLGNPNYGYDWPLPFEKGVTKAESIGNKEAVQIAIDKGVDIKFDENAQSPHFTYWQYGIQHEVWFEDVRSVAAKFDLIKEFGLRGAGYWKIMTFFRPNWLLAEGEFLIQKV